MTQLTRSRESDITGYSPDTPCGFARDAYWNLTDELVAAFTRASGVEVTVFSAETGKITAKLDKEGPESGRRPSTRSARATAAR
ncbi:hypothetical protein ACFV4K_30490 [Nocardia sp. NPDC059764]|uniref:hypothetical protein n=1 Tax=Nocardia sp. NPDC059764 TaxID=3346939 RepID=UPI003665411E